jgi:predicted RNA-binding protein with PIN domain
MGKKIFAEYSVNSIRYLLVLLAWIFVAGWYTKRFVRVYLIDGYNLLHRIPDLEKSASPQGELVRFIKRHRLTGSHNNRVTVVFDGHEPPGMPAEGGYSIVFSEDRSADDVIKERVAKATNKSQVVVVSDDREIRDCARGEGATICRVDEFLKRARKSSNKNDYDDKDLAPSSMMDITGELEKIWLK